MPLPVLPRSRRARAAQAAPRTCSAARKAAKRLLFNNVRFIECFARSIFWEWGRASSTRTRANAGAELGRFSPLGHRLSRNFVVWEVCSCLGCARRDVHRGPRYQASVNARSPPARSAAAAASSCARRSARSANPRRPAEPETTATWGARSTWFLAWIN